MSRPRKDNVTDETLIALYENGSSSAEIAKTVPLTPAQIQARLKRAGKLRPRGEAQRLAAKSGRHVKVSYWKGRKKPRELVEKAAEKIRGEKHWLWKGGKERRPYRQLIRKEKCATCGSRLNLCIHHKDFDHYNNVPDNLQVLCVSCHLSLHKKAYWHSKKTGETPKKSTKPSNWKRKISGRQVVR